MARNQLHQTPMVLGTSHPAYGISWEDNKVDGFLDKLNEASGCDTSCITDEYQHPLPPDNNITIWLLPTTHEAEWNILPELVPTQGLAMVMMMAIPS